MTPATSLLDSPSKEGEAANNKYTGNRADIVIIGAGIAGQAVRWAAEAKGLTTLMIETPPSPVPNEVIGSQAALGLIRVAWLKGWRQQSRAKRSLAVYAKRGLLLTDTANIRDKKVRLWKVDQPDWAAVDVEGSLRGGRRITDRVHRIEGRKVCAMYGTYEANHAVALCAGYASRSIASESLMHQLYSITAAPKNPHLAQVVSEKHNGYQGYFVPEWDKVTFGSTLLRKADNFKRSTKLEIVRLRPYLDLSVLSYRGEGENPHAGRIGSSTALNPSDASERLMKMMRDADAFHAGQVLTGQRVYLKGSEPQENLSILWGADYAFIGGFGKFGYSLAPAMGEEFIDAVLERNRLEAEGRGPFIFAGKDLGGDSL